jgi:general stress protein 26
MPESKAAYDNLPVRYPGLTSEDLEIFLKGKWIAYLATVDKNGTPHVKPIWYIWENNQISMITWLKCKSTSNLENNKKVAITIQQGGEPVTGFPTMGCLIHGTAELIPEIKNEIKEDSWHFKIFSRYLGKEACYQSPLKEHLSESCLAMCVKPNKIISWDYTKPPR